MSNSYKRQFYAFCLGIIQQEAYFCLLLWWNPALQPASQANEQDAPMQNNSWPRLLPHDFSMFYI